MLLWSLTLDQTKAAGSEPLGRDVTVRLSGLVPGATYELTHVRVDEEHSNVASTWGRLREEGQDWPTEDQWQQLREADRLEEPEPARAVTVDAEGVIEVGTRLPMPSMSQLVLVPRRPS